MPATWPRILLTNIDRAAEDILRHTDGVDRKTYVDDASTQAAVARSFRSLARRRIAGIGPPRNLPNECRGDARGVDFRNL